MSSSSSSFLTRDRLEEVVAAVKETLSDQRIRKLSQRAVQAKVWHLQPTVAACLSDLRREEERIRTHLMKAISRLVYQFHDHTLDATLARAGILSDDRVHAGSSLEKRSNDNDDKFFDLVCLDAKERLYLILQHYGWLQDFFRHYPHHFYENSFRFVDRIPHKKLRCRVRVVGMGIGGSMALSGLAKHGIDSVVGYEKRDAASATSRYQNASWRAYDVAERLLDDQAYQHLLQYRQRIHIHHDDGTEQIVTSDRVQIILGSAIEAAQESAQRYGAQIRFESTLPLVPQQSSNDDDKDTEEKNDNDDNDDDTEEVDIVALFAGAHTCRMVEGLADVMGIHEWPDLDSSCKMWLRITESEKTGDYCTRGGEIGAEHWHYTIESARNTPADVTRVRHNLDRQYQRAIKKSTTNSKSDADNNNNNNGAAQDQEQKQQQQEEQRLIDKYEKQSAQLDKVLRAVEETGCRFDYIFTNAPDNEHNLSKRESVGHDGTVVLDGGYTVEIKMATQAIVKKEASAVDAQADESRTSLAGLLGGGLVVLGGDACVPPNPLAAYGATLACEAADMVVKLAVAYGHINSILAALQDSPTKKDDWIADVLAVKEMFADYYNARSLAENYFQFVQTLICNLYSIPPPS